MSKRSSQTPKMCAVGTPVMKQKRKSQKGESQTRLSKALIQLKVLYFMVLEIDLSYISFKVI